MNVAVMVMAEVPLGVPGAPEFFVDVPLPQPLMQSARGRTGIRKSSRKWEEIRSVRRIHPKQRVQPARRVYPERATLLSTDLAVVGAAVAIVMVCDADPELTVTVCALQLASDGRPEQVSEIVPVKPPRGVTVSE
jgi:hypothetical protein